MLVDWLGTRVGRGFWAPLLAAGGEVRVFNPPQLDAPFGWLSRDHRKALVIDDRVAFITGVCLSARWEGDAARGIAPWRDTGVALEGPAVSAVADAFEQTWAHVGPALAARPAAAPDAAGDVAVRVLASEPAGAGVFRLDQVIAGLAQETLFLTDAYFVGLAPYVQGLRAAALDGVDVRLLVPGTSDVRVIPLLSRAGYRPLLEAGVRIFEWDGPMLHAKTAVADGRWARVGSTNLNLASWVGNWELDLVVEDATFAAEMETMHEADLLHATEIVLDGQRVRSRMRRPARLTPAAVRGSARVAAVGALRVGATIGAAISRRRTLEPAEARVAALAGAMLLAVSVIALLWPVVLALPLAVVTGWVAISLFVQGWRLRLRGRAARDTRTTR